MNEIQIFEYMDSQKVRTVTKDGDVWFVANDVCLILNLGNPRQVISDLDDEDKDAVQIMDTIGRPQKMNIISQAGLIELITRSRKPDAKKFKRWIFKEVIPRILRTGTYSLPAQQPKPIPSFTFLLRYAQNQSRVPQTHFSVISELVIHLYGKLELAGYKIKDRDPNGKELRPDVSVGKLWAKYLKEHYPEDAHRYLEYMHLFPNGHEYPARMYELELLPKFRLYVEYVWIKEHAYEYFQERDPKAIDLLRRLIPDMRIPNLAIA